MGNAFSTDQKKGRERAQNEEFRRQNNFPVKLIEPSSGNIVELQVLKHDQMYISLLRKYARCLEKYGVEWTIIDNTTIRLVFDNENMAESARQTWRK